MELRMLKLMICSAGIKTTFVLGKVLLLVLVLLDSSCIYEESSETTSIIENLSDRRITITAYDDGVALTQETHVIEPLGRKTVLQSGARGKFNALIYPVSILPIDSMVVSFDSNVKATHYTFNVSGNNAKAVKHDDPRSLYNRSSYKHRIVLETKYNVRDEYIYTFTQQDYLNAGR